MSNPNGPRTERPPTFAQRGMIATPHYLASSAGLRTLRHGGSAVDAISGNAVLCVAYPHMAGLGGDGFWLVHNPREGKIRAELHRLCEISHEAQRPLTYSKVTLSVEDKRLRTRDAKEG